MYDFGLFIDPYLKKVTNNRSADAVDTLSALCEGVLSALSQPQVTLYKDKAFVVKDYAAPFNPSYFQLYIESLIVSKTQNQSYLLQFIQNPRIKDHSRTVEITVELTEDGVRQSRIRTVRGSDDDLWYFLIQLADFSVVAKFKHQSGIPV